MTSICEMVDQLIQKKQEEKQIQEDQAANTRYWKIPAYYDDNDDEEESNSLKDNNIFELPPCSAVIPNEPVNSLIMGDVHLDTVSVMESDEFIKSSVENLVPNPSESEGENGCDLLACFTTFSNILFDDEYEFDSADDQSLPNEDFPEEIFLNPLFEEEISSIKIDQHHFNAESDLVESMLNRDSSIISSSSKIDSLLDEFAGELTLRKSIPPGIDETNYHPENEIRLSQRLLYDNSSLQIDLTFTPDDPIPPSIEDNEDFERDILFLERLLHDDPIPLPDTLDFSYEVRTFLPFFTYPVKEYQKMDKIESKPDKNGKRGEAEKSQKQLHSVEEEKLKKMQKEGSEMQNHTSYKKEEKNKGQICNLFKVQVKGEKLPMYESKGYDQNGTNLIKTGQKREA
nr:hypothetical protein [Tanacetum cinerariifolium]